jgi:hypothetical protein
MEDLVHRGHLLLLALLCLLRVMGMPANNRHNQVKKMEEQRDNMDSHSLLLWVNNRLIHSCTLSSNNNNR